jgi:hypothetical protein
MGRNNAIVLDILNEIDRARAGNLSLDELETAVWRHLERLDESFPRSLLGRLEDFVQELRALRRENIAFASGTDVDPDRGAEVVYNEVTGALGRILD